MGNLEKLANDIFKTLKKYSCNDSCILATKVFIELSNILNMGISFPLTVQVGLLNEEEKENYKKYFKLDTVKFPTEDEINKLTTQDQWAGHLVAVLKNVNANNLSKNKHIVIDLTISQLSPILVPKIFPVCDTFITSGSIIGVSNNNLYTLYKSYPAITCFKCFDEWENPIHQIICREVLSSF